jgi:hypothetical protein
MKLFLGRCTGKQGARQSGYPDAKTGFLRRANQHHTKKICDSSRVNLSAGKGTVAKTFNRNLL